MTVMKWLKMGLLLSITCLSLLITSAQDTSPDADTQTQLPIYEFEGVRVEYQFDHIKQGRSELVKVTTSDPNATLTSLRARLFNRDVNFFTLDEGNTYYAFLTANIEQSVRSNYDFILNATWISPTDNMNTTLTMPINVRNGGFIQQNVTIPEERADLVDAEIETNELNTIFALASPNDGNPLWQEGGFIPPLRTELTSPFGAVRVFNETFNTRHTGWDFQATIGQPMQSTAAGEVVFAGMLPIRGNYVLIHHGLGIYSGYAHLSVSFVTTGQMIFENQLIGQVGSTGRSSGAHAHIEFIVDGQWIDGADFIRLNLPVPDENQAGS